MSNFSQNGINFTIENNFTGNEKNHPIKGKLTSLYNDYAGYEQDDASKLINAVEIDWNGAKPGIGEGESGIKTGEIIRGTLRGS
jgi:hypothetical protein